MGSSYYGFDSGLTSAKSWSVSFCFPLKPTDDSIKTTPPQFPRPPQSWVNITGWGPLLFDGNPPQVGRESWLHTLYINQAFLFQNRLGSHCESWKPRTHLPKKQTHTAPGSAGPGGTTTAPSSAQMQTSWSAWTAWSATTRTGRHGRRL